MEQRVRRPLHARNSTTRTAHHGHTADRRLPNLYFRAMTAMFKIRDWFRPRSVLLDELPLKAGDVVMDYGCGPGAYISELAARVGATGTVVAVDIHPLAIERVTALAQQQGWSNIETYLNDGVHLPNLGNDSVDVALLCDIFHMLGDPAGVLAEIARVLRPNGVLAVNDPHMNRDRLIAGVMSTGHFRLVQRGGCLSTFTPSSNVGLERVAS